MGANYQDLSLSSRKLAAGNRLRWNASITNGRYCRASSRVALFPCEIVLTRKPRSKPSDLRPPVRFNAEPVPRRNQEIVPRRFVFLACPQPRDRAVFDSLGNVRDRSQLRFFSYRSSRVSETTPTTSRCLIRREKRAKEKQSSRPTTRQSRRGVAPPISGQMIARVTRDPAAGGRILIDSHSRRAPTGGGKEYRSAPGMERKIGRARVPKSLRRGETRRFESRFHRRDGVQRPAIPRRPRRPRRHHRLFRMQPRFASIPLVLCTASRPRCFRAASIERQATLLIDWHVSIATGMAAAAAKGVGGGRETEGEREREIRRPSLSLRSVSPSLFISSFSPHRRAYTYLAYSMIGRRLITIEIGSRVVAAAIPTRVTALLGLRRA